MDANSERLDSTVSAIWRDSKLSNIASDRSSCGEVAADARARDAATRCRSRAVLIAAAAITPSMTMDATAATAVRRALRWRRISSLSSSSLGRPISGATTSSRAARYCGLESENVPLDLAGRKSAYSGSAANLPLRDWGMADVRSQSKSEWTLSQTIAPSLRHSSSVSTDRLCSHHCTSCCTQRDLAAAGEASSTR